MSTIGVCSECSKRPRVRIAVGIIETAAALGVESLDLATAISYETAGSFDPLKRGPVTQWGQHRGLIQFGKPQALKHGVDWDDPIDSQLGPNGAVANYLRSTGVKAGHGLLQIYSAINAGSVGRYSATDENNGGAPGTVREKVAHMVRDGHQSNAERILLLADQCSCLHREGQNSTYAKGDQEMTPCLRKAGLFAIRVYHNPPENVAEVLRNDYNDLENHWDIKWDRGIAATGATPENKQEYAAGTGAVSDGFSGETSNDPETVAADSGFYCILASPKNATDAQGNPTCPPALAFRGSEPQSDELRGLLISLRLRSETILRKRNAIGDLDAGKTIARGQIAWPFHIGQGWEDHVRGEGGASEETFDWQALFDRLNPGAALGRKLGDAIGEVWDKSDFDFLPDDGVMQGSLSDKLASLSIPHLQDVLHADGQVRQPPTTWLMRQAEDFLGGEFWSRYNAHLTLHYSEMGDWAANVTQALGLIGSQYRSVIEAVDAAIPEATARGNRLNITGHSLGGGLAQYAALYCRTRYPDIRLGCQIFNAAGLHENTAQEVDSSRGEGRSIPIFCQQVAGELLTTAQTPGGFPLVWDIFRWQGVEIPTAIGIPDLRQGISPGPFPVGAASGKQFDFRSPLPIYLEATDKDVADGDLLPFVFPLASQTRYRKSETVALTPYGNSGNTGSAPLPDGVVAGPLTERNELDEIADLAAGTNLDITNRTEMVRQLYGPEGEIKFPHIEAIAGIATDAENFNVFAEKTAEYLMNALDEDIEERNFIESISPIADLFRLYRGARQTYDEFAEEIARIGQLGALSGAYHPMDIGGSTFLRPPKAEL